jgi:hypothetical protein
LPEEEVVYEVVLAGQNDREHRPRVSLELGTSANSPAGASTGLFACLIIVNYPLRDGRLSAIV